MDASPLARLRVATLNVCRSKFFGTARRTNELHRVLGDLNVDLVALPELDHGGQEFSYSTSSLGESSHLAVGNHSARGGRGVGLLTRFPIAETSQAKLNTRWFADKGFVRVVISPPEFGSAIEVIGLHLDPFSRRVRSAQVQTLAAHLGPRTMPRIVLGDLNAMTARAFVLGADHDDTVAELVSALDLKKGDAKKSFPSRSPIFAIDWVLVSRELVLADLTVVQTTFTDHAAVVADVVRSQIPAKSN